METLPLIIAGDRDPHVAAVVQHMEKEGVSPVIVNRATLASEHLTNGSHTMRIGEKDLRLVTAIWYRRSLPLILPEMMEDRWVQWCEQESGSAFLGLLYQCRALWVNDPLRTKQASLKPLQLHVAPTLGLKTPDYLITSCPEEAERFARKYGPENTVIKPLGKPVVGDFRSGASTIFTNTCHTIEKDEWESIRFAPSILQQRIRRIAEIRVTVVGSDLFAAEIDVSGIRDTIDYRTVDPYTLPHRAIELPADIAAGCMAITESFGLRYAAIDFLKSEDGSFYFTELNPSGQWLWIEELTGLDISRSLAALLMAPPPAAS